MVHTQTTDKYVHECAVHIVDYGPTNAKKIKNALKV
jgi:hypothetical protein